MSGRDAFDLAHHWRQEDAALEMDEARAAREALAEHEYYGTQYGGESRPLCDRVGLPRPPGLVSIPTTQKRRSHTPFAVKAASQAAAEAVDGFEPDPAARRLSRLRMCIGAAAACMKAELHAVWDRFRVVMVTLTYAGTNADWDANHIRAFMDNVRKWCAAQRIPCRYVWVAELQKRGVIHYHVALWLPQDAKLPKPDKQGWWKHGMTRIETARDAAAYLMKYLSKGCNEIGNASLPRGARSHGRGGLGQQWRDVMTWLSLPSFVKAHCPVQDVRSWRRVKGGGWLPRWGGDVMRSEFQRVIVAGKAMVQRVCKHGRPMETTGAWSFINPAARAASLASAWGVQPGQVGSVLGVRQCFS